MGSGFAIALILSFIAVELGAIGSSLEKIYHLLKKKEEQ